MNDLQFPIGRFDFPGRLEPKQRELAIEEIERTPGLLRDAVAGLSEAQLDTPYRPDGWTVRQVVHHLPDSHLNTFVRFKRTLTESHPTVGVYDEKKWAELPDAAAPIDFSLRLLEALHDRWVYLLKRITDEGWARPLDHPELGQMRLDELLAYYAWHGRHHLAHITNLRRREGW